MKLLFNKSLIFSFSLLVFAIYSSSPVFAVLNPFQGQQQDYTVTFRGNGEAAVESRIVFTNQKDTAQNSFSFTIPKVKTDELMILQQKLSPVCERYDYSKTIVPFDERECLEYKEPDYNSTYYYDTQDAEYKNADFKVDGDKVKVTLPYEIAPDDSSALIISYYAFGYTTETLGRFSFNFETFKVDERVKNVNVSIGVDSELILKDQKSEVNYRPHGGIAETNLSADSGSAIKGKELDQAVSQIGTQGLIQKSASNLAEKESFTVKGEYAKQWIALYYDRIAIAAIIVTGIVAIFWVASKRFKSKSKAQSTKAVKSQTSSISTFGPKGVAELIAGLVSAGAVVGLIAILRVIESGGYFVSSTDEFIDIALSLIVLLLFVLAIFGPAIFVGAKKGWRSILAILGFELGWIIVFLLIYILIFPNGVDYSEPPLYESGGGAILD